MSDKSAVTTEAAVGDGVSHMGDMRDLGMVSLAGVGDLHHGAAIASVGVIGHVLDPAVRERHAVLALDVAGLVPAPALAEVCVVVIVVDPVGEVEWVGLITLLMVATVTSMTSMTNETSDTIGERNTGDESGEDGETGD